MRVGLIRQDEILPDLDKQTDILRSSGLCTQIFEVDNSGVGYRRLEKFLRTLSAGDVVCVVSLDVCTRSLGRLIRLLASLMEVSISVSVITPGKAEALIPPRDDVLRLLQQLAACEPIRGAMAEPQAAWHGRRFPRAEDFSLHQRDHVHTLHAEGMSLRAIGLIFRTSPGEIWKVLAEGRRPKKTSGAKRRQASQ